MLTISQWILHSLVTRHNIERLDRVAKTGVGGGFTCGVGMEIPTVSSGCEDQRTAI